MSCSGKSLWKRTTAILLSMMLIVPELLAVSAAAAEEQNAMGSVLPTSVRSAVYETLSQPPAGGTSSVKTPGSTIPSLASTQSAPLTWNLLRKVGLNFADMIYSPDNQLLKMSGDGRYIAFKRLAIDLGQNPPTVTPVISVFDRVTGAKDDISMGADARSSDEIVHFDMSDDARFVAFSYASGLTDERTHIYLYDRRTRERTAITAGKSSEKDFGDGDRVSISGDGRYVAFDSAAKQLVPGDQDDYRDVFVYDRDNRSITRISTRPGMEDYDYGDSKAPSISSTGRYIAFQTDARLIDSDTEGRTDIYLYDSQGVGSKLQLISRGLHGAESNGYSIVPSISDDGQVIAFASNADNLVDNDINQQQDIFVYQRGDGKTVRVSNQQGGIPFSRDSVSPSISPDGRYVGFHLDSWDADIPYEAFIADVAAGTAYRVTVPGAPYRLANPSHSPIVGKGGSLVVFSSEYEETLGGIAHDYYIPGIFIASQGSAPTWPPGSKLEAADRTDTSVRLSWSDATDSVGVIGYQIYKDSSIIGYADRSGGNTFTVTGLLPGAEHQFQVEAVNASYHTSFGGPTYKLGTGGGENPGEPIRVIWDSEGQQNGVILPGSKLKVTAFGSGGKRAAAKLTYTVWKDDVSQETHEAQLTLAERSGSPGGYDAEWTMPEGVSQIRSLVVTLTDPLQPGTTVEQAAGGFPLQVSGTIVLAFQNTNGVSLANSLLFMSSSQSGEQMTILSGNDPLTFKGIQPDKDYSFRLVSPDYRHTWGTLEHVRAAAGKLSTASMKVEPPARLRFQVVDPTGMPVSGVRVDLFDPQQNFIVSLDSYYDGWTNWIENLEGGKKVVAKVDIGDRIVKAVPNQDIVLTPGSNEISIQLEVPGEGVLQGTVKSPDGQPVRNALVTSTQTYRGQSVVRKTRTNLEGAYRLQLLAGDAEIEAYESSYQYSTDGGVHTHVTEGQTRNMDIAVRQPSRGVINMEVRLKSIKDLEFGDPVDMSQAGFYTRVETRTGWQSGYFSNTYSITGSPGDPVSVCVTGTVPTAMTSCTNVLLDANAKATAKLYLEEKGARIEGRLAKTNYKWISASIYRLQQNGYRSASLRYVGTDEFDADGAFSINVPESGTFVMEISAQLEGSPAKYEYSTVQFSVADKQILQLGSIALSEKNSFSNYYGNYYDAMNGRVTPGGTVTLRAGYKNSGTVDVSDARLLFDIPEGATPVKDAQGRIVANVTGSTGEPTLEGQTLIVPIGAIAVKQSGTVSFQVKIDSSFHNNSMKSSARIRAVVGGKQIEETLGSVLLDVPQVTLEAPDHVFQPSVQLSGVAPANSVVKVYDGKELLGSTAASASGFWTTRVELPKLGDPGTHALRAETEANGVKLHSPDSYVIFDTKKPRLLEIAMAQAPEGKWVTLNVRDTIQAPPYTVVPGNPFQFELLFDKPDKIESAYIYLDGQLGEPIKAVRDGGIFRAFTPTDRGALGDIYVDFDTIPEPVEINSKPPAIEEIQASLPLDMRDFKTEVTAPFALKDGKYSGTVKLTFPKLEHMTMAVTLSIEPNANYRATSEEQAEVERSGVPLYKDTFELTETEDGFKMVSAGYIPMNVLFPQGLPAELKTLRMGKEVRILDADPAFAAVVTESYVQFGPNGSEFGTFNSIKSQYDGMKSFAGRINRITHKVQTSGLDCLAELPATVKQAGKALAATVGGEVAKAGLGIWTGFMGLSGAGAIAAAGTSAVVGAKIDSYVDGQIDAIGTGYNQCRNDDEETKKRKKYKKVKGRWIYDPSGYVYEAVPENRLSGVKATVLYQDPVSKEWKVWNAAEYEQVNPHETDDQGKYGWDVPEGKWKVVWEKAGYETQSSAELDVPPPHTEVHAGLISREAPKLQTVTGVTYTGGSYVDIGLTKYVKVTSPADAARAVSVMGTDGSPLAGTVAFVRAADNPADPGGAKLSRIVRFTPETAVPVGSGYTVKVKGGFFQSYSGVWMNDEQSAFAVTVRDERGPEPVSATVEAEGRIVRVAFNETVSSAVYMSSITLNGSGEWLVSAVKSVDPGSNGRSIILTFSEPLDNNANGQLTFMAGAVTDPAGNESVPKTLTVTRGLPPSNGGGEPEPTPLPVDGSSSGDPFEPALTKVEAFTGSNGGAGLRITLQSGAIERAIQSGPDGKKQLLVEVKEQAEEYSLQLTADVRAELKKQQAAVIFKTVAWQAVIPAAVIDQAAIPTDASLQLTVGKASASEEKEALEAAALQSGAGLRLIGQLRTIRLESVSKNNTTAAVFMPSAPIRVQLPVDETQQEAVYLYDEAAGVWTYVWGQKADPKGGMTDMEVKAAGTYAVMAYMKSFSDIAGHWSQGDIRWMGQRLLVNGAEVNSFKPDQPVTRAEFAAMLVRALGLRAERSSGSQRFSDVGEGAWYYASVGAAAEAGLIDGVTPGLFEPDANITREQMALMVWRAYEYLDATIRKEAQPKRQVLERFADRDDISVWAADAVALLVDAGFIQGTGPASYEPKGSATRAQAAAMMRRLLQITH